MNQARGRSGHDMVQKARGLTSTSSAWSEDENGFYDERATSVPIWLHPHRKEMQHLSWDAVVPVVLGPRIPGLQSAAKMNDPIQLPEMHGELYSSNSCAATDEAGCVILHCPASHENMAAFADWSSASDSDNEGALVVKIQYVPSLAASVQRLNEGRPSWPNREHVVNLLAAEEGLWSAGGHLDNKRLRELEGLKQSLMCLAKPDCQTSNKETVLMRTLQYLACWQDLTPGLLIASKIAEAIEPFCRHQMHPVREMAKYILSCWRQVMRQSAKQLLEGI